MSKKSALQKQPSTDLIRQINELVEIGQAGGNPDLGFMARMLVQATLPHTDPGDLKEYMRVNGNFRLVMQPGPGMKLPYGSYPRLLLAWITTEAVRTKNRQLILGVSLSRFMHHLGLIPSGGRWGTITRLREQMKRLFSSRIAGIYDSPNDGTFQYQSMQVANKINLWWSPKNPEQTTLWESTITLGEEFFEEIIQHPVPFDVRILKIIKKSPLGLDLYMWLTYRVFYLKEPVYISWASLHRQFGSDYGRLNNFTAKAKRELAKIKIAWPELHYETPRGRLVIYPSSPSIPPTPPKLTA